MIPASFSSARDARIARPTSASGPDALAHSRVVIPIGPPSKLERMGSVKTTYYIKRRQHDVHEERVENIDEHRAYLALVQISRRHAADAARGRPRERRRLPRARPRAVRAQPRAERAERERLIDVSPRRARGRRRARGGPTAAIRLVILARRARRRAHRTRRRRRERAGDDAIRRYRPPRHRDGARDDG